jgi:type VI secretion system secreted protein VgrG
MISRGRGHEKLSEVSRFDLDLLSPSPNLDPTDFLGAGMTIEIINQYGNSRYINALVTSFTFQGPDGSSSTQYLYKVQLSSWLFLASKVSDCKIYQRKTIPQIIQEALADFGMPFELQLSGSYGQQEYVVNYNETILTFIMRLAEDAGIYWWVRHALDSHTIVFCDGTHPTLPDYENIAYLTSGTRSLEAEEYITEWHIQNTVTSGRYRTRGYNFAHPSANLDRTDIDAKGHDNDSLEMYEWTSTYTERDEGGKQVTVKREQQQLDYETITGSCNVRGMAPGYKFTLNSHPRDAANAEYLILSVFYSFQENHDNAGAASTVTSWDITFTVMSTDRRYYPPRITKKPIVAGPHVALVTGPAGQEIWCDKWGRVVVHFYWDRYSKKDENSSKFIRVSNNMAGNNFGGMYIPRMGQEVLVVYINGDINLPYIIGRAYNQENMPPWDLPANATQSGILTRSTPDGQYANANAIRFEDKKGAEQVWIQAERNMDTVVEHDETHHVMHDRLKTIDHDETVFVHHDRTETVDNNETITVHNNRQERVDHNETISIGDNRTEDVGKNETLKVGINRSEHIGANETIVIGGGKMETVALAKAETIGLAKALSIGGAYAVTVGGLMNTAVAMAQFEEVGKDKSITVGDNFGTKAGKTFAVQAGGDQGSKLSMDADSISLVIGKSSIVMKKTGEIVITGEKIQLVGADSVNFTSPNINNN